MNDRHTCAKKLKLLLGRDTIPRRFPSYPAPEFFKHTVIEQPLHNLDISRRRKLPTDAPEALMYIYYTLQTILGDNLMARTNKPNSSDNMPEMISSKLTDDELSEFDKWLIKASPKIWELLSETLLNDTKLGVSWDAYNDCFIASFTGRGDRNVNSGRCLMSRSSDWQEAIALNLYKSSEIYKGGKWENRNADKQRG